MEQRAHWVELRIHGVSGTPPQEMLRSAHVVQVAGDETSSFFRPADSTGNELPSNGHVLEGYHWGKFTSGSWRQGLWLTLLPFGLVNAAQFMLPRPGPPPSAELFARPEQWSSPGVRAASRWHALVGAMLRLLGLALTCMLLLGVAVVLVDLTAWQWAPARTRTGSSALPGWPLAGALLACAAVLPLLSTFGRDNRPHETAGAPPGQKGAPDVPPTDLGRASFFRGDPDSPQLRRLHEAVGLTFLALIGFAVAGDGTALRWCGAVWLTLLGLVTVFLGDPERGARGIASGRFAAFRSAWHDHVVPAVTRPMVVVSAVLLAVAAWGCARRPHTMVEAGSAAPGVDGAAFGVLVTSVAGLLLLFAAGCGLAVATRETGAAAPPAPFRRFALGLSGCLVTSLGVFLGVGYSAALCYGWASLLNRGAGPRVEVPPLLQRVAYAWGVTVILVLGVAAAFWICSRCRHREFLDRARAAFTFGGQPDCRLPERWLGRVASAMFAARVKNWLERLCWVFAAVGIVASVAAGAEYALSHDDVGRCATSELPGPLAWLSAPQKCGSRNLMIGLGTLALLGLAGGLLLLGRGALRRQSLRRGVNVVWDVLAFWPRAVHPFVPPPYSQLAVVDLRNRIRWHLGTAPDPAVPNPDPATHLIVAAHSQGSLIGLSALLWLSAAERARIGLVTFGSQLQVQFPRAFPAYVDVEVLRWMLTAYDGRWVSLYRDTDAIAGPVLSWQHAPDRTGRQPTSRRLDAAGTVHTDGIDRRTGRRICGPEWRLLDPTPSDPGLQTGPVSRVRGHSDYPEDPDWPAALAAVTPVGEHAEPLGTAPVTPPPVTPPPDPAPESRPRWRRSRPVDHGLSPPFSGGRVER